MIIMFTDRSVKWELVSNVSHLGLGEGDGFDFAGTSLFQETGNYF
jgi:hypothetical protein